MNDPVFLGLLHIGKNLWLLWLYVVPALFLLGRWERNVKKRNKETN